jgi:Tol biopolymer transport system component
VIGSPSAVFSGSIPIFSFQISPDGKRIAFSSFGKQEDLFILNSDGSDLRQITNDPEKDRGPSWSRDGRRIYFYSHRGDRYEIWSIGTDGSGLTQITRTTGDPLDYVRVSPDGSRFLTSNDKGSYIWRFDRGQFTPLPRIDGNHVFIYPSWLPDGLSVVGLSARANDVAKIDGVVIYSLQTNRFETISNDSPSVTPVSLPGGRRVIYVYKDRVVLVDALTKQKRAITPPIPGVQSWEVSPDGRALYVQTSRAEGDVWLMTEQHLR